METMIDTQEQVLTRADRCDATCPAAAMVRVTTKTLGVWLFCGHHYDLNKDAIPGITHVHDERNPLTVEPKTLEKEVSE